MHSRRQILKGLGLAAGAAMLPGSARATGLEPVKILQIFLHRAPAHSQTLWVPANQVWQLPVSTRIPTATDAAPQILANDDAFSGLDHAVMLGDGLHPLASLGGVNRTHLIAMRGEHSAHTLASAYALSGINVGNPAALSLGARVQDAWGTTGFPNSWILDPQQNATLTALASATGSQDPNTRPFVVPVGSPFVSRLHREHHSRTDTLLAYYCEQFGKRLEHGSGPVRAPANGVYDDALSRMASSAFDSPVNARRTVFDTYFNRHQDCMECHTTTYSTTDPVPRNEDWDRYYPATTDVDLEFSAFWTVGPDHSEEAPDILDGSLGGDAMQNRFKRMFSRVQGTVDTPGVKPWGFDERCVNEGILEDPLPFDDGDPDLFAGWGDQTGTDVRILDFMNAYDDGFRALAEGSPDTMSRAEFEGVGAHPDADLSTCNACHDSGGDADGMLNGYPAPLPLEELTASMSAERIRLTIEAGSPAGQMAGGYAAGDAVDEIVGHLVTNQTDPVDIYTDPTVAMAHLTALAFVDDVAKHLSGQSLTLDHGFPRNADQASALATLSDMFIEHDWSLRVVIKTIALSELINRNAPDASGTDPYILPMVVDPWQDTPTEDDADPITGVVSNGQGDLVHRWPVATLIRKRNAALGWSQPTHFDDVELQAELGTFVEFERPGFTGYNMASALAWETNHTTDDLALCRSPYGDGEDVIDALTDADLDLTLVQALQALKFRLIGDEYLWSDIDDGLEGLESNRIAEIWDVEPSDRASDHQDVVRDYCAVLLASPQFIFAGVPSDLANAPWNDPEIPCMDEECTEVGWCERYRFSATDLGYETWSCYEVGDPVFEWGR